VRVIRSLAEHTHTVAKASWNEKDGEPFKKRTTQRHRDMRTSAAFFSFKQVTVLKKAA
jgi:hypothetical protein